MNARARRDALVVCDVQPDALGVLTPLSRQEAFLYWVQCCVELVRRAHNWTVCYTGLQFAPGYEDVSTIHKLFGSLPRLHKVMGEDAVHWFLSGYPGCTIHPSIRLQDDDDDDDEKVFWRNQHVPSAPGLSEHLKDKGVSHVTLVGMKVSTTVQILAQCFCDAGFVVYVVTESVADDTTERRAALLQHLLPLYATVLDIVDWIEECQLTSHVEGVIANISDPPNVKWICNVGRGGHGSLWTRHILQYHTSYQPFPRQRWYASQSFLGQGERQFYCPLGKKVIDFCDELQFSRIAMYLKGRENWDEKDKLVQMACQANDARLKYPRTYFIKDQVRSDSTPDKEDVSEAAVWFLKETNKNGGKAVSIYSSLQDCVEAAESAQTYVVQRHISNPLLTVDGYKCHVKFYSMLVCDSDGISWNLFTYRDSFLAVADQPWDPASTNEEIQITTLRHYRLREDSSEILDRWPVKDFYTPCRKGVEEWMGMAIESGKLQGRKGQRSFEIFSADFMFVEDDIDHPFLIEFNGGPVLFDATLREQILVTRGLKRYHKLYQFYGEEAPVNDHAMIRDGIKIALSLDLNQPFATEGRWDRVGTFQGIG